MISKKHKKRIGELLIEAGWITKEQLDQGINKQKTMHMKIGEIFVNEGWITEVQVLQALEFQLGIPYMDLDQYSMDYYFATFIPEQFAKKYKAVAWGMENEKLKVAMKDPLDLVALEDISLCTEHEIIPFLALESSIMKWICKAYTSVQTSSIVSQAEQEVEEESSGYDNEEKEEDKPFILLVNNIIERCILFRASDVHIEPFEKDIRIRYRIDGQLYELTRSSLKMLDGITSRIKILAGMDIAERRLPQDGRLTKKLEGQKVDMRVSTIPTLYGEKTVIRFIYRIGEDLSLEEIGFYPSDYEKMLRLLKYPHGIILLTGPTGSGKSTTLAAALKVLNQVRVNIVTVEDPVENRIEGINQISTNAQIGLTFAQVLRAILRQDPDIMMIGEMRDSETAHIAIRAAITGHLVLSTLHTNDAASSISRLMDMGIEDYMVSAALKGVISQRLVRRLCKNCRQRHQVTRAEEAIYKIAVGTELYEPKGCSLCNQTGYRGRFAVHEVLLIDDVLREKIALGQVRAEEITNEAQKRGMRTLRENVLYQVLQGNTSMEEMLKVAYLEG